MKKSLFCLFFLIAISSFGQDFGVRFGVLASTAIPTKIDSGSTGNIIPTFSVGASSYLWRNKRFGVLLDVIYAQKSASYTSYIGRIDTSLWVDFSGTQVFLDTHIEGPVRGKSTLEYLDIPLQFAYFPTKGLSIMAGPMFSPLISGRDTGTAHIFVGNDPKNPYNEIDQKFDNFPYIRERDWGLTAGIAYQFRFGLFMDVRVQRHFRTLYRNELFSDNNRKVTKAYQTGFTLGIGYRIGGWKEKG